MYHTVCFPLCYFNSRSRVWNDPFNLHESLCVDISIHVPAWGTNDDDSWYISYISYISIHVPAWGTTSAVNYASSILLFQSTFPRGERQLRNRNRIYDLIFQSTFPRRERQLIAECHAVKINFNPRSRVGNDSGRKSLASVHGNFNPRSRVGNDQLVHHRFSHVEISIHVPAWGTTLETQSK